MPYRLSVESKSINARVTMSHRSALARLTATMYMTMMSKLVSFPLAQVADEPPAPGFT